MAVHPGPLPRGEGESIPTSGEISIAGMCRASGRVSSAKCPNSSPGPLAQAGMERAVGAAEADPLWVTKNRGRDRG
jgi:hypothetical protein